MKQTDGIAALLEEFDISAIEEIDPQETEAITLWLPIEYKEKYDLIQEKSRRRFGKFLKGVIKKAIDNVNLEGSLAG